MGMKNSTENSLVDTWESNFMFEKNISYEST